MGVFPSGTGGGPPPGATVRFQSSEAAAQHRASRALPCGLERTVLDLFVSKAWAGRDKDRIFSAALVEHGYVHTEHALALVAHMPLDAQQQRGLHARIRRWSKGAEQSTGT